MDGERQGGAVAAAWPGMTRQDSQRDSIRQMVVLGQLGGGRITTSPLPANSRVVSRSTARDTNPSFVQMPHSTPGAATAAPGPARVTSMPRVGEHRTAGKPLRQNHRVALGDQLALGADSHHAFQLGAHQLNVAGRLERGRTGCRGAA
jgi:hypothetical protein